VIVFSKSWGEGKDPSAKREKGLLQKHNPFAPHDSRTPATTWGGKKRKKKKDALEQFSGRSGLVYVAAHIRRNLRIKASILRRISKRRGWSTGNESEGAGRGNHKRTEIKA